MVALGGMQQDFWLMVIGRAIFGLGAETTYVLKATYTALWFHDQEISLAMGLNSAIPFMFSYLSGFAYPAIAEANNNENLGVGQANMVGLMLCLGSLCFSICLVILDSRMRNHDNQLIRNANLVLGD